MTAAFKLQSLAQLSAERILNCTAEGMIIALLAWVLLRAVGRQNSGTRFAVWFAALMGIAALPFLGQWSSSGAEMSKRSEIIMPASWALYIFGAWSIVAAAGLFRVAIGFWQLHRLRKSCVPVELSAIDPVLRKTLDNFGSARPVQLCMSDKLRVPTAIGFTKAMVVIPSWTMRALSAEELNAVLLHELAHLRRRDDWTNLVQKVLGALLFFHPAVWWIEKKLSLEREMACDDMVLAQTTSPRAYAECLVSLAEKSFLQRGLALAQAAVGRLRHMSLRVSQILDVNRPRATRVWRPAPVVVTGVSLVCLVALSYSPTRLVSFGDSAANAASSVAATGDVAAGDLEMSQISRMGARVVPAKLGTGSESAFPAAAAKLASVKKPGIKSELDSKLEVVPANLIQYRANAPKLVRASLDYDAAPCAFVAPASGGPDGRAGCPPDRRRDAGATGNLFFVTRTEVIQTRQCDASGAVVWDLYVWRIIVVGPVVNRMEAGTVAKSI